ncbi:acid-shock protein [Aminobacter sp. P9b]|uniref:EF-hand domain-containing protein n=1 Tax=unclassified Aminobacter TaxID=2644704 RepID=UPI000D36F380|nr:acid-shock protein [Aminobacter sp. MSH1]AWC24905.1 EF hand [Aminobacter sp. MSH1]
MSKSTKIAIAFLALAGTAGTSAFAAAQPSRGQGMKPQMRFERADADKSGDVTFEEFTAAMNERLVDADGNADGKITVAEVADQIQRMRAERMAERLIKRFDANGDGELTKAEIESRQKKMFAMMDRNDDGKIVKDEMPTRNGHGKRHQQ